MIIPYINLTMFEEIVVNKNKQNSFKVQYPHTE
jgi:hypothetical protein